MDWSADGWQGAFWIELRVHAIGFAARGWPVLPGTYPEKSGWVGRDGSEMDGPRPLQQDWNSRLGMSLDEVTACWSERPYSLLVATGSILEALEVDATLGRSAAGALRAQSLPVPIIAVPDGRWYFLTAAGTARLDTELAATGRVRLHSKGSWLPLPPTPYLLTGAGPHRRHQGVVHWRSKPEVGGWRLPDSEHVQDALLTGLNTPDDVAKLAVAGS